MATEQPLWRGKTIHDFGATTPQLPESYSDLPDWVDVPPGTELVVLSASHYDALVDQAENQLPDAQLDAEGWEKEYRRVHRLNEIAARNMMDEARFIDDKVPSLVTTGIAGRLREIAELLNGADDA